MSSNILFALKKKWKKQTVGCQSFLSIWGHSPIQVEYCIKQSLSALKSILKTIPMSFSTMVYHFICKMKIFMCLLSCNCRCFMYYSIDTMFTYSFVKRIYYGQKIWKNIVDQTSSIALSIIMHSERIKIKLSDRSSCSIVIKWKEELKKNALPSWFALCSVLYQCGESCQVSQLVGKCFSELLQKPKFCYMMNSSLWLSNNCAGQWLFTLGSFFTDLHTWTFASSDVILLNFTEVFWSTSNC